jgi:hypothetical protein
VCQPMLRLEPPSRKKLSAFIAADDLILERCSWLCRGHFGLEPAAEE